MKHLFTFLLILSFAAPAYSVTRTWTGSSDLDFNNSNNWSPSGAISGCDLVITQTSVVSTSITLSATVSITSLTMTEENGGTVNLIFGSYSLTTTGDFTANGNNSLSDIFVYQDAGSLTVNGDFNWGFSGNGDCYYYSDITNPGFLTFKGDVNIGLNGRTVATYEPDFLFDGTGTQTVTLNNQGELDGAHYFLCEDLQIGSANTPTVVITGTYQQSGIRAYDGTSVLIKAGCKFECNGSSMDKLGATSGTWTMEAGSELEIGGTFDFPLGYSSYSLDATSTTEYSGTNQNVSAITYGHLQFTGSGTKTSAGSFSIQGDLLTNTAFANGNDSHTFNGSSAQTISGSTEPTFYTLIINNSSSGLSLLENVNVSNLLTLTDGLISTSSYILALTNSSISSANGYSSASYVNTGSSGTFRRYVNSTGSYDFPLGNSNTTSYQLMNLNLTSGSVASYFDSRFENLAVSYSNFTDDTTDYTGGTLNNGGVNNVTGNTNPGVWTLNPDAGTAVYDLTLYGRNFDNDGEVHTVIKRSLTDSIVSGEDFSGGGTGSWSTSGSTVDFVFTDEASDCNSYTLNSTSTGNGWAIISGLCDGVSNSVRTGYLTSPVMDCSNLTNIMWTFEHHYDDANFSAVYLEKNIDGSGWTNVDTYNADNTNATSESYTIADAAGSSSVQLRFRYTDKDDAFWAIDDIRVSGKIAPYTAWTVDGTASTSTTSSPITAGRTELSGFSQFAIAIGTFTLPIELSEFTATPIERHVELNWITESESDNDFFTIEKTRDGVNFEYVGTVDGAGNSTQQLHYNLWDLNPYIGISYYRLKQTDFNGDYKYSEFRAVEFFSDLEISIFPNPIIGDQIGNVKVESDYDQEIELRIKDNSGRLVYEKSYSLKKGANIIPFETKGLSASIYFLKIIALDRQSTLKFIKE